MISDRKEGSEIKIGSILLQVSKTRVELIVEALKKRLRSRVALQKQLDALVKVRLPPNVCTFRGV